MMKRVIAILAVMFLACMGWAGSAGAIVGGAPAASAPSWMGSMQNADGSHGCGASLIKADWALTAFHCVENWMNDPAKVSQIKIKFGNVDRNLGVQTGVASVHVPPGATLTGKDIALVKLTTPVNLPVAQLTNVTPPDGVNATLIGWGITCAQSLPSFWYCGQPPVRLHSVDVKLSPDVACNSVPTGIVGQSELCVGSYFEGKTACYGDSGGPAIVGGRVAGVTSRTPHAFLYGNCYISPVIYTDVSVHRGWINSLTGV